MQNRKGDTDVQNRFLDSVEEGEGGMFWENSIETCILSRVKQITSPGWMHERSARTWFSGKTQRDRVEREVGGGIGMGNTCKSMADSCQCMTKTTTIKRKKSCLLWIICLSQFSFFSFRWLWCSFLLILILFFDASPISLPPRCLGIISCPFRSISKRR